MDENGRRFVDAVGVFNDLLEKVHEITVEDEILDLVCTSENLYVLSKIQTSEDTNM